MVRATLLLNVLALALVVAILLGVEPPAPDDMGPAAETVLARLQVWAAGALDAADAAFDRLIAWAEGQLG